MSKHLQTLLERFRQQRRVQAGSLIVTVFGDSLLPRGGRVWLGSLIRLMVPLGINERLVRTSVFRLVKDDWLRTETVGRRADYLLTESGQRRCEEAARHIYASEAPSWDGRWRIILAVGDVDPKRREQLRQSLFWQGFGALGPDCFVHPGANLPDVMESLRAEGLSACFGALLPLVAAAPSLPLVANDGELVRRAWALERLAVSYGAFIEAYQPILDDLAAEGCDSIGDQSAFLLRTLLIHDYRRLLLRDPLLPEALLPADWPGSQARRLCMALYACLEAPVSRHLESNLMLADGEVPRLLTAPTPRFAATAQ